MAYKLKISEFSSLSFSPWRHDFEIDKCYIQKFSQFDKIRCQISIADDSGVKIKFRDFRTGIVSDVNLIELDRKDGFTIYYFEYENLDFGRYQVFATNYWYNDTISSCIFDVLPPEELENTVLFKYQHFRNEYDVIFTNDEDDYFSFDFRVEGGFLYAEMQSNVENNTFRDQRYNIYQLSANPYKVKPLTIGTAKGVPQWVADKVNFIFSLSDILIGDDVYTRSEGSTPELVSLGSLYPLYVIKIDVEPHDIFSEKKKEYPDTFYLVTEDKEVYITTEDNSRIKL